MHFYAFMNVGYAHTALILQCSTMGLKTEYILYIAGETFIVFYAQPQIFYLQRIAIGNHCYHKVFPSFSILTVPIMCQSVQYVAILTHKVTKYNCQMPVTIYRYIMI